jgi:hypothetical protein
VTAFERFLVLFLLDVHDGGRAREATWMSPVSIVGWGAIGVLAVWWALRRSPR